MKTTGFLAGLAAAVASLGVAAAPFGNADDVDYATKLWQRLSGMQLVGSDAYVSVPYPGAHPHGAVLDTVEGFLTIDDNTGEVIIKRNYMGDGVSKQTVANDPARFLDAVTVMYRRSGYDSDNRDWFWVKYDPAGKVLNNPDGVPLAGRVAKGAAKGCIACHTAAPGGDLVFNHDRYSGK